ncbi:peptidyl-prolyl cis-trans isomerase CYP26-2, chloroplastic [Nicotiana sylvestris]|uniref:Peptidyl-prolyl cis-trans isomerase CYP26-2, chloroplastic n=1 Tax=Nicotiana sylvestris TaxID=4096 RepID=A0A1U7XW54_NICSY|nr:PREDICTED: peptidyl-prolyl cis-trans isomerase CYP26-2, chloroplastic [Nicotiana sylvestris]
MQSSPQFLQPSAYPLPPKQIQGTSTTKTLSIPNQCCKFSRRELAIGTSSSLLLLLGSQAIEPLNLSRARADGLPDSPDKIEPEPELEPEPEEPSRKVDYCSDQNVTNRAFLEVSVDGEPIGRIVIGLYGDGTPVGSARFNKLVSGAAGVSYRRKEFARIMPNYVQHGGLRSFGVDAELAKNTGRTMTIDNLVDEWEKQSEGCQGTKNVARSVSIIVRDPSKPPPKMKLVARKGKLEIDQEELGKDVNGTEFTIAVKDSPELDASALVIGRVLDGMDVVERIGQVKTVKENTSSPYFRVAKLIGDKRAVVAERGFNRPYSKVIITNCGLMD